jgi:hypothetical protein
MSMHRWGIGLVAVAAIAALLERVAATQTSRQAPYAELSQPRHRLSALADEKDLSRREVLKKGGAAAGARIGHRYYASRS